MITEEFSDKFIRATSTRRGNVGLKTDGQVEYVRAIRNHDLTLCAGPAGTGKTFLAVACALEHLHSGRVSKIVLSRPAVEAGESLGYLPGEEKDKIAPYMRPLFDALHTMLETKDVKSMLEHDVLELAPLAYIRGRTFNRSFLVLDEAQNTTVEQMKTYLTRLGRESKSVVIGDVMQIDIPSTLPNGFTDALTRFKNFPEIARCVLNREDIQRHALVQKIVDAYDNHTYGDLANGKS